MESEALLKKIFEHQLLLSKEIQKRLDEHLTDNLRQSFERNEKYLGELLKKDVVSPKDLEHLQHLWEVLTSDINEVKATATKKIDAINTQEAAAKLYPDSL